MNIRNVEFDFDILRAADADRFQQAVNEMQAAAAAVPKASGLGAIIRANCAAIDNFLADVLGDDYDQRLVLDTENLREMKAVYQDVLNAVTAAQKEFEGFGVAQTVAGVDVKARAAAAAKTAAASLPGPVYAAEAKPAGAVAEAAPVGSIGEAAPGPVAFPLAAAQPTPQPPVDFSHMNRAQRRAYIKSLTGRK